MYLPMIIGILILGAIAGGFSIYDDMRQKKLQKEKDEQDRKLVEETMKAFHADDAEAFTDADTEEGPEDERGVRLADLVENSLRSGSNPFIQIMKYAGRNEDWNVAAVDSYDNIYIIETELRPEFGNMLEQIEADKAHYRTRMQKKADKRQIFAFVVTNHPSEELREEAEDDPNLRIFNYRVKFRPYKIK